MKSPNQHGAQLPRKQVDKGTSGASSARTADATVLVVRRKRVEHVEEVVVRSYWVGQSTQTQGGPSTP